MLQLHIYFSEENIKKPAIPKKNEEKVEQRPLVSKVRTLLSEANIDEADLVTIAASKGHYKEAKNIEEYPDDFLSRWVIPNFKKKDPDLHIGDGKMTFL